MMEFPYCSRPQDLGVIRLYLCNKTPENHLLNHQPGVPSKLLEYVLFASLVGLSPTESIGFNTGESQVTFGIRWNNHA